MEVWEDDVHHVDPSVDESQGAPLNAPTYFPLPLSSSDPRPTVQFVKRPGDSLESGAAKEPRTERRNPQQDANLGSAMDPREEGGKLQDVYMEDYGVFSLNGDNVRLALAPRDVQNGAYLPIAVWSLLGPFWVRSSGPIFA